MARLQIYTIMPASLTLSGQWDWGTVSRDVVRHQVVLDLKAIALNTDDRSAAEVERLDIVADCWRP